MSGRREKARRREAEEPGRVDVAAGYPIDPRVLLGILLRRFGGTAVVSVEEATRFPHDAVFDFAVSGSQGELPVYTLRLLEPSRIVTPEGEPAALHQVAPENGGKDPE